VSWSWLTSIWSIPACRDSRTSLRRRVRLCIFQMFSISYTVMLELRDLLFAGALHNVLNDNRRVDFLTGHLQPLRLDNIA